VARWATVHLKGETNKKNNELLKGIQMWNQIYLDILRINNLKLPEVQ